MASISSIVRVSARQSACWRECKGCTDLAPLAPNATHCNACRAEPRTTRPRRLTAA